MGTTNNRGCCSRPIVLSICVLIALAIVAGVVYFVVKDFLIHDSSSTPSPADWRVLPPGLTISTATAAYQVEGAWNESGKGENIWDRLTHNQSELIADGSNGDVACDSYHLYKEDVAMIYQTGFSMYRFSTSWSRVIPTGKLIDGTNAAGLLYYHRLIDELIKYNITPMVTLYHWDLPQALQDEGGWTNPIIADHFLDYADLMFKEYGTKVKWWITLNEPKMVASGYNSNELAPAWDWGHGTLDYQAIHNMLRAHAKVYRRYDNVYRPDQQGKLAISNDMRNMMPYNSSSVEDQEAVKRFRAFWQEIFTHPVFSAEGDYPAVVRERVDRNSFAEKLNSSRLPYFTEEEKLQLKGSSDFLAFNHYWTVTIKDEVSGLDPSQERDSGGTSMSQTQVPEGLRMLLNQIKSAYNNTPMFITENGCPSSMGANDTDRIKILHDFLESVLKAIHEDGCNVIGYTAWSLMDNFEWRQGYTWKYGLWEVDFQVDNRTRSMKQSAHFFREMMKSRTLPTLPFSK